uniref:Uncharacterized protein n=1 Tax=Heterorhabditis bacteriophora TaxID=37862 RepID=A0A1I7WED5_HETBA
MYNKWLMKQEYELEKINSVQNCCSAANRGRGCHLQLIKILWVTGKTKCNSPSGIRRGLEMVVGIHYIMS